MSFPCSQHWLIIFAVPYKMNNKEHKNDILVKRLPGCELYGISKTTTICYFVKVCRVESEERKKDHQSKQNFCSYVHFIIQQHSNAKHNFQHYHDHTDVQCIRNKYFKESTKVCGEDFKVLF